MKTDWYSFANSIIPSSSRKKINSIIIFGPFSLKGPIRRTRRSNWIFIHFSIHQHSDILQEKSYIGIMYFCSSMVDGETLFVVLVFQRVTVECFGISTLLNFVLLNAQYFSFNDFFSTQVEYPAEQSLSKCPGTLRKFDAYRTQRLEILKCDSIWKWNIMLLKLFDWIVNKTAG